MSEFGRGRFEIAKSRVWVLGGVVALLLFTYISYLFSMQIVDGYIYSVRAAQVTTRSIVVPAQRGEIYDRSADAPLVSNVDSFAVDLIPSEVPRDQWAEVVGQVAGYLRMSSEEIEKKIPAGAVSRYQPVELKSGLTFATISLIAEHLNELPGITWRDKPIRNYIDGNTFAQVVGYVGDITPEELQILYNQGYTSTSVIGKSGVEYQYDKLLRGQAGRSFRTVDARGRNVNDTSGEDILPVPGNNLVLTLDRRIQRLAQDALGPRSGSIVVLKPATGEILAMVSYPTYDPNAFYTPSGSSEYQRLILDSSSPFLNRAIQAGAAPASTFKVIMTAAVLDENAFPSDAVVNDPGYFRLGDRIFRCWQRYGHGPETLMGALADSCDVYFYTMGVDYLGIDVMDDYAHRFGYGEKTGIDLPGELSGLVPDPAWKQRAQTTAWVGGDTVNMSIGQGALVVTPLQMADMMAMVVNNGVVYKPHVLKQVRDHSTGEVLQEPPPEVLRTSPIKQSTFDQLKVGLRGVITHGTAEPVITTDAVKVAGKTGTGEVGLDDAWNSWFVAYGPYDATNVQDEIVVVVWVDASNTWEWWAPKAANILLHGVFANMDYDSALKDLRAKGWWY